MFKFSFENIKNELKEIQLQGYNFISCKDYVHLKRNSKLAEKIVVIRIDIDFAIDKVKKLLDIFDVLQIKASFYLRLHAKEYNPFSFENYKIIKRIIHSGHELGYHSEIIDQAEIWNEDAKDCLIRDLKLINQMFDIQIDGVASHGGMTGLNNLDFWKVNKPKDFGLLYEAYDEENEFNLFNNSLYISDSSWTYWKSYEFGKLIVNDNSSPLEQIKKTKHPLIYLLIHPDTYFDEHFYE
jgi:hypothetical protein